MTGDLNSIFQGAFDSTTNALRVAAGPTWRRFTSGQFYGSPTANVSTTAFTAGDLRVAPFLVGVTTTFDRIAVDLVTGAASSTVRMGIYSDNGSGYPAALVLDAGTVGTTGAAAILPITISQSLAPGLYWLGSVSLGGTPTLRMTNGGPMAIVPVAGNATDFSQINSCGFSHTGVTTTLPTTFTTTVTIATSAPRIMLRAL